MTRKAFIKGVAQANGKPPESHPLKTLDGPHEPNQSEQVQEVKTGNRDGAAWENNAQAFLMFTRILGDIIDKRSNCIALFGGSGAYAILHSTNGRAN
jgi:hypothetical protein